MTYHAPVDEIVHTARLVGQDALAATPAFAEATAETRTAILEEAARLCQDILLPLNRQGDTHPATLENGVVRCPPGFAEGYRAIAEGGWVGIAAGAEHGGMGLPQSWATMLNEMMGSANLSLAVCPLLTQGQIDAIEHHATEEIKALYLPKLTSGEWTGTMNLSEPQAGSDVGALATKAERREDGTYAITGQKIWISFGDHDVAGNVVHLVLARLPDAPKGTRGISLFLVPKRIPDAEGDPGVANAVRCIGVEEKLGLHGSPTCVMEYDGATGWLIGEENKGLACMFTMMNNARLGVGVHGISAAEAALQRAVAWAGERRQGRTVDGSPTISGHPPVRRMLAEMTAQTRAARAIAYACAQSIDMARAADDQATRAAHEARAALLTPIAKAYGTDTGREVADMAIQIHGGMGYVEETGVAQLWRDVRVTAIYEGTNEIQAVDLAGRKLSDGGAAAHALLAEVAETAEAARAAGEDGLADALEAARRRAGEVTDRLAAADSADRFAGAAPYLRQLALVLGAHFLLKAGLGERARMPLARYHLRHMLPGAEALAAAATSGAEDLYALAPERLAP